MPQAPKKPCLRCKINLTRETYCEKCKASVENKFKDFKPGRPAKDPKVKKWLNSSRYKRERKEFLAENPFCSTEGCNKLATILDHKTPHKGDEVLFWDPNNWQPKCKSCHDKKTASHDGGFGNPRR